MLRRILPLSAALTALLFLLPLAGARAGFPASGEPASPLSVLKRPLLSQEAEPAETATQPEGDTSPEESAAKPAGTAPEETEDAAPLPETLLRVKLPDGSVDEMALEDYLWGVVAAEMPANFEQEALRAQAVAARTYTLYQQAHPRGVHPEADVCTDYTCCQAWISREDRLAQWPEDKGEEYAAAITDAVTATAGQVLYWQGEPILAVFHAASGGETRSAASVWGEEIPYLVSVDTGESESDTPDYYSVVTMTPEAFSETVLDAYPDAVFPEDRSQWFSDRETDETGKLSALTIGGVRLSAGQVRTLFGLRSADITLEWQGEELKFFVTGYGHGVGMSQYGANAMAAQGADYQDILAHYYPDTVLETR